MQDEKKLDVVIFPTMGGSDLEAAITRMGGRGGDPALKISDPLRNDHTFKPGQMYGRIRVECQDPAVTRTAADRLASQLRGKVIMAK